MTIEELQHIANKFPGVTYDIKWEDHLCFNVGGKMFLITSPDSVPHNASLKVAVEDFEQLTQIEGIIPAPYLARYKWIQLDDINRFSKKEWEKYLPIAYHLIFDKLPAKIKREVTG